MYYENYRHSVNSLLMYNILRENGVPDEHVSNQYNKNTLFYPYRLFLHCQNIMHVKVEMLILEKLS